MNGETSKTEHLALKRQGLWTRKQTSSQVFRELTTRNPSWWSQLESKLNHWIMFSSQERGRGQMKEKQAKATLIPRTSLMSNCAFSRLQRRERQVQSCLHCLVQHDIQTSLPRLALWNRKPMGLRNVAGVAQRNKAFSTQRPQPQVL